jgi:hypothetical protein
MPALQSWEATQCHASGPPTRPCRFWSSSSPQQLHPGNFKYALHHLIDHEVDLPEIEAR